MSERAALEAISASIPEEAMSQAIEEGSPSATAGIYLAALVVSLRRVVQEMKQAALSPQVARESDSTVASAMTKRQRQKARKRAGADHVAEIDSMHAETRKNVTVGKKHSEVGGDGEGLDAEAGDKDHEECSEDVELVSSIVYLIGLALRDASAALVSARSADVLDGILSALSKSGNASAITRHSTSAIAGVLVLLPAESWTQSITQRSYQTLVALAMHVDPKTRHRARRAICGLDGSDRGAMIASMTGTASSLHICREIRELASLVSAPHPATMASSEKPTARLIHAITTVSVVGPSLTNEGASALARDLLGLLSSHVAHADPFILRALQALFDAPGRSNETHGDPSETQLQRRSALSTSSLGKVVVVLAEHELPDGAPAETYAEFSKSLACGAVAYFDAHTFSPPPAASIMSVLNGLVGSLEHVVGSGSVAVSNTLAPLQRAIGHKWLSGRPDVFEALQRFAEYKFKPIQGATSAVVRRFIEDSGCAGKPDMREKMDAFAEKIVANRDRSLKQGQSRQANAAVSMIVSMLRGGGAQSILAAVKFEPEPKTILSNAWLLPLMHEHNRCSHMALYHSALKKIGDNLDEASARAAEDGRAIEAKNARMLSDQVLELLPSFCRSPTDLVQDKPLLDMFETIAEFLGRRDRPKLIQCAFTALRALSASVSAKPAEDPSTLALRARFGKCLRRVFPLLCKNVETLGAESRGGPLDALTAGCRACGDSKTPTLFLRKSIRRMLQASVAMAGGSDGNPEDEDENGDDAGGGHFAIDEDPRNARHAAADIAIAVAESGAVPTNTAEIDFLERAMVPLFMDSSDPVLQKKAYRASALLASLGAIGNSPEAVGAFVSNTASAASYVAAGAKASRLGLVKAIVEIPQADREVAAQVVELVTTKFLTEVVLGTRDVSEKTRQASFTALSAMARSWVKAEPGYAGLRRFLQQLAAGLAGRSVTMLSSTLTSISHIVYEFRGEAAIDKALASDIDAFFGVRASANEDDESETADAEGKVAMECESEASAGPISILMRHSSHEVQRAALGSVKTATSALGTPPSRLIAILPAILPGLVAIAAKSKKKATRLRVRVILERLLRKCGREEVEAVFPAEHAKLLAAVRKQYSRDLVKKHKAKASRLQTTAGETGGTGDGGLDSSDEDIGGSDESGVDSDSDVEREILDGDVLAKKRPKRRSHDSNPLLVREDEDHAGDLLDSRATEEFVTRDEAAEASRQAARDEAKLRQNKRASTSPFKTAEDGRPRFVESDSDEDVEHGSVVGRSDSESDGEANNARPDRKRKSRGRASEPLRKRVKGAFGDEYRSKRGADGDMKRPGKPDPYAYVPLGGAVSVGSALSGAGKKRGNQRTKRRAERIKGVTGLRGVPARR